MSKLDNLKRKLRVHFFRPTLISVFLYNAFFMRKGLYYGVKEYAANLNGRF